MPCSSRRCAATSRAHPAGCCSRRAAGGRDPPRAVASVTPLGHLRVLDLSRQLPGPFCSTLLADFGADVLMIARPDDPFATGIPFLARNKRSMTLNLKAETGREIFL